MGLLMSQDDFARALRGSGVAGASKRLVQRWESGATAVPRPAHARALERITGLPIEALGFGSPMAVARVSDDGHGGHDVTSSAAHEPAAVGHPVRPEHAGRGNYSGIWLSRYEYFSSGRDGAFVGSHYVVVLQHGNSLTVRSLAGSAGSRLTMDLEVDGAAVTGTWVEHTAPDGYYRGARYHGAVQLLVEPTGHRLAGKWVGFGKNFDINSGPWELVLQDASTTKAAIERYNRLP
jgi:hypothetical protein